jgi:hypothetical protein
MFKKLSLWLVAGLMASAAVAAYVIPLYTNRTANPATDIVAYPAYLVPYTDPTFGTKITRIVGNYNDPSASGKTWPKTARHYYSKTQAWDASGTLLALDKSALVLDGTTYQPLYDRTVKCSGYSKGDERWHPTLAKTFIHVPSGNTRIEWYNIDTCTAAHVVSLPALTNGFGPSEGQASMDGRYVVLTDGFSAFVVDLIAGTVGPSKNFITDCGFACQPITKICSNDFTRRCLVDEDCVSPGTCENGGHVTISPSGDFAAVVFSGDHIRIYDVNKTTLALTVHDYSALTDMPLCASTPTHTKALGYAYDLGHADFAYNPFDSNTEVLVGQRRSGSHCPVKFCTDNSTVCTADATCLGIGDDKCHAFSNVIMFNVENGKVLSLAPVSATMVAPVDAESHHLSAVNYGRSGWVYASYKGNAGNLGKRYYSEIVALRLDGLATERLGRHHSSAASYDGEAHGSPSRDGRRVIFASQWDRECAPCSPSSTFGDFVIDTLFNPGSAACTP